MSIREIKNIATDNFYKILILMIYTISILLIISAFILPPPGQIDNSVLVAVGELFAFAGLLVILYALKHGKKAKISKGDTTLEVGDE